MSDTIFNPKGIAAQNSEKLRETAIKSVAQARAVFEKANAAAKDAAGSLEASSTIVAKGLSEFNAKAFEAFQANSNLTLEFCGALAKAKNFSEAYSLQTEHGAKLVEALKAQGKDLSDLASKIAKESAEPLKAQLADVLKPAA